MRFGFWCVPCFVVAQFILWAESTTTPSLSFLVRSYAGDCHELRSRLLASFDMFLDERQFPVVIVLDDESEEDHALGRCLQSVKPAPYYNVTYEKSPAIKFYYDAYGGSTGYMRQQWSNFYGDIYSQSDIVCFMDSDSLLYTRFMLEEVLSPDQKIIILGKEGDNYKEDEFFVSNVSHTYWLHKSVANMAIDRFPICFWRQTLTNFREHVVRLHGPELNTTLFDKVFERYQQAPGKGTVSQFSAIASYASIYEGHAYEFRNVEQRANEKVFIGGQHGPDKISDDILAVSCCAMLALEDPLAECNNRHLRGSFFTCQHNTVAWGRAKPADATQKYPTLDLTLSRIVDRHLLRVHRNRSQHTKVEERMHDACYMRLHLDEYIDGCTCCAQCKARRHHSGGALDPMWHMKPLRRAPFRNASAHTTTAK